MSYWAIWLIIVILLIAIEAMTINLVSIWFIASGIVSLFVSLLSDSFFIQFAIFVVLGIVLLILTRANLLKKIENKKEKTNLDLVIGMEGFVTQKIRKNTIGEVKVAGKLWSAVSNTTINEEEIVKVKEIQGVKIVVEKVLDDSLKEEEVKKVIEKTDLPEKKETTKKTTTKKTTTKKRNDLPKKSGQKNTSKRSSVKKKESE